MVRDQLVTQVSARPTAKVTAGTASAGTAAFVIWLAHRFAHLDLTLGEAEAVVVVVGFAGAWLKKERAVFTAGQQPPAPQPPPLPPEPSPQPTPPPDGPPPDVVEEHGRHEAAE